MVAKRVKYNPLTEIGSTGLKRYSGRIYEDFLKELRDSNKVRVYKEMADNDPMIGAIIFSIQMLIRQVDWQVVPCSQENDDIKKAEFLETVLSDMDKSWQDTISEIMSMITYGWSFHEVVYKRRIGKDSKYSDGRIGWKYFPIRSQDTLYRWDFDKNGQVLGMEQLAPPDYNLVYIPMEKALLFTTTSDKGSPEGRSILRNAYRPWYFKKNIETIEGIGIERDLAGLPVAWVPPEILSPDATKEDKVTLENIKEIIRNIRRDEQEGVVFPLVYDDGNKMYDLKLLSSGGQRQFDTSEIIDRYDQRIAMSVMADFILLGSKEIGSFALASSKTELFSLAIQSWLKKIAEVFNKKAIPKLFKLNGWPASSVPQIVHGDIESVDLDSLGNYVSKLVGAGALVPDNQLEKYLRRQANIPVETSDETM